MSQIEISEAAADLRGLVERARAGEDVVLVDEGRSVVRLVPLSMPKGHVVTLGRLDGEFVIPDDFDAPLPDDLLDLFEGKA